MPDWTYGSSATSSASDYIWSFSGTSQQIYDEWKQECEREDRIYELRLLQEQAELEEERQLIKDKERYPLFFLKDGIV